MSEEVRREAEENQAQGSGTATVRGPAWCGTLSPFLAATYFVLSLAASNAISLNGWRDLAWPIPTVLALGAVCWAVAYVISRSRQKASLLSLLWVFAFSVFGYVADALLRTGALQLLGGELGLLVIFLVILFGPSLAICRTGRALEPFNRYATLVAGLLVLYTSIRLYWGLNEERSLRVFVPPPGTVSGWKAPPELPDIYLIILDQYTGGEVLKEHFGYDNGAFEGFLRSRGFFVPKYGHANYPQTQLALASMLNLDYVQNLPQQVHLYDLIENNRLAAYLKRHHYRFVFFPTGFKFTSRNRNADLQLPEPTEVKGEFGGVWQRTTMLPELFEIGCKLLGCRAGRLVYVSEGADLVDWKFEQLQNLAGGRTPIFVFAHLGITHEPYLYNADCTHREPYWPANGGVPGDQKAQRAYLDQISCVNSKLATLVDSILARSTRPTVILLQADHGHGRLGRHLPVYGGLSAYQVRERLSVFSAYLLPGLSTDSVGDSITPINTMRLVLRHYLGADLPPLEEASYWSSGLERPEPVLNTR